MTRLELIVFPSYMACEGRDNRNDERLHETSIANEHGGRSILIKSLSHDDLVASV